MHPLTLLFAPGRAARLSLTLLFLISLMVSSTAHARLKGAPMRLSMSTTGVHEAQPPRTPEVLAQLGGASETLAISGTLVFQNEGPSIVSWDVSSPAAPIRLGSLRLPAMVSVMVSGGGQLYVGDEEGGVSIVAVDDPATPQLLHRWTTSGAITGLDVAGDTLYVARQDVKQSWLHILDVSNPLEPTLQGQLLLNSISRKLDVAGDYAYVVAPTLGVAIVDVTAPQSPTLTNSFLPYDNGFEQAYDVQIVGDLAYVAYGGGLRVVDVSNVLSPTLIASEDTPAGAQDIAVVGNWAYLAGFSYTPDGVGGLSLISLADVANPTPTLERSKALPFARAVMASGETIYFLDLIRGLQIFALGGWGAAWLPLRADPPSLGYAGAVRLDGERAYVLNEHRLTTVDIGEVDDPQVLSSVPLSTTVQRGYQLEVEGSTLYVTTDHLLSIYDITFGLPTLQASLPLTHTLMDFKVLDGVAYVPYSRWPEPGGGGLYLVDVSDRSAPVLRGHVALAGNGEDVDVADGFAYVANDSLYPLQVVQVDDVAQPVLRGRLQRGSLHDIQVVGSTVYGGNWRTIDVSDPDQPQDISEQPLPVQLRRFHVDGSVMYAARYWSFGMYDISNPQLAVEMGTLPLPHGGVEDLAVGGGMIALASEHGGLYLLGAEVRRAVYLPLVMRPPAS